jgi:hypothetical protein
MNGTMQILTSRTSSPLAHAGHGPIDANHPLHYLMTPEHLMGAVAFIACIVFTTWFIGRLIYLISKPT